MTINENYKIESEGHLNVVLYQKRIVKEGANAGNIAWDSVAFCPNVKSALKTLVNREINGTGLKEFEKVVEMYDSLMGAIENLEV